MNRKATLTLTVVVLGSVLAWATPKLAELPPVFEHTVHIDEGLECSECHQQQEGKNTPVLNREYCKECHDGVPAYRLKTEAREADIAFPHALHAESFECNDCHKAMATDSHKPGQPYQTYAKCESCHAESDVVIQDAACAKCHGKDMRKVEPKDHSGAWMYTHGDESTWRVFNEHGKDCKSCHGDDSCATCHKQTRPRSHTGLWRIRTHGLEASFDRESCKTCHETGGCVRCHQETQPLSHKGPWKYFHGLAAESYGNQHCATCHSPGTCARCHN